MGFSSGSVVKNLPAKQETWVRPLGQEDPLENEMATCSSILTWEISWTEEPGRLQSMGSQRVRHDWATSLTSLTSVYMLIATSPFILPLPLSFGNHSLFSMSVGLFALQMGSFLYLFKDSSHKWYYMIFVYLCLAYSANLMHRVFKEARG